MGLPTPDGGMHKGKFQNLQSRLAKRILLWGNQSQGGKEILIKAVAQALPTHIMGVFKLPFELCDDLTHITRNFWWGAKNGKRKTHWVAWDNMVKPKSHGGMGFRDMRLFNQALLARQAWRLLQELETLSARVLRARYYADANILDATLGQAPSQVWRSILEGRDVLSLGLIKRIGDGSTTRIWSDNWIPRDVMMRPFGQGMNNPLC